MTIRPGANLVLAVAVLALVSPLVYFSGFLILLLIAALTIVVIAAIHERKVVRAAFDSVTIRRTMPTIIGRNVSFDVTLAVSNANGLPLSVQLRDVHPDAAVPRLVVYAGKIPAAGVSRFTTHCRIPSRG